MVLLLLNRRFVQFVCNVFKQIHIYFLSVTLCISFRMMLSVGYAFISNRTSIFAILTKVLALNSEKVVI